MMVALELPERLQVPRPNAANFDIFDAELDDIPPRQRRSRPIFFPWVCAGNRAKTFSLMAKKRAGFPTGLTVWGSTSFFKGMGDPNISRP